MGLLDAVRGLPALTPPGVGRVDKLADLALRRFDASIEGLGGCPIAPGAAGNLAAEDLALLAEQSG